MKVYVVAFMDGCEDLHLSAYATLELAQNAADKIGEQSDVDKGGSGYLYCLIEELDVEGA